MHPLLVLTWLLAVPTVDPLDSNSDLFSLIEAERRFARMSVAEGMRNAFFKNFREDAIVFPDGPANGKELWKKRESIPILLLWEPAYADISIGGDFGFTTGPSEMRDYGPQKRPPYFGYFVSVWKKDSANHWGVALDVGISTAEKSPEITSVGFPLESVSGRSVSMDGAAAREELVAANEKFAQDLSPKFLWDRYVGFLSADAWFYRDGQPPFTGKEQIRDYLEKHPVQAAWKTEFVDVARAGDMGYAYGSYQNTNEESNRAYWVKIWKKNLEGWKIVVDVVVPPRSKPKPQSP